MGKAPSFKVTNQICSFKNVPGPGAYNLRESTNSNSPLRNAAMAQAEAIIN